MKVLLVNTLYAPYKVGGAEVSVQILAENLVYRGHDVKVICTHDKNEVSYNVINGVKICYLPLRNVYWPFDNNKHNVFMRILWHIIDYYNFFMMSSVKDEILKFSPDIVHTNNVSGFSVSVWDVVKKLNIPLIHTSRDYYLFHPNTTLFKNGKNISPNSLFIKIISKFKKKLSKKVDYYIGISNFVKKFHINNGFFDCDRSFYIYNGIKEIKESVDSDIKIKRIGFLGRLEEEKGYDLFCNLAEKYAGDYKFVAAGRFRNENDPLVNRTKDCNIEYLGFVDLSLFLQKVDAVILPIKWNEPFGRVVVECALAGKIVYTNLVGGISELVDIYPNIHDLSLFPQNTVDIRIIKDFKYVDESTDLYIKMYNKVINREKM